MEMGLRAQAVRPEINGSGDFDAKPILKPGGRICQCTACNEFFSGVADLIDILSGL